MFRNEKGEIRSGWMIAGLFIIIFTAVQILSLPVMAISQSILVKSGDIDLNTTTLTPYGKEVMGMVGNLLVLIQELCFILLPIFVWKFFIRHPLHEMGLKSIKKHWKEMLTGLAFGLVSITIVFFALILTKNASIDSWKPEFTIDLLIGFVLYVSIGFAEEIFSRGFVMSVLRPARNYALMFIVPSALFTIMHAGNANTGLLPFINIFLAGLLFSYIYFKSGNLWMCIGYHIMWNFFQGNIFGFVVSGQESTGIFTTRIQAGNLLNGGDFGPEGGLFCTLVLAAGFLFTAFYYRNSDYQFLSEGTDIMDATAVKKAAPVQGKPEKSIRDITATVNLKTIENSRNAARQSGTDPADAIESGKDDTRR